MKPISIQLLQVLDTDDVDKAMEEACVDCYGEDEQCSALADMVAQALAFPFPATVMGEAVEVVDSASSKYDPLGLDLAVVHQGKQHAIAAHCVELVKPLDESLREFDLADMFGAAWIELEMCGYHGFYISRVDGQDLSPEEVVDLQRLVEEDLFYDYTDDELSVWFDDSRSPLYLYIDVSDRGESLND